MKSMYRYFHPIPFNAVRFVIASVTMLGMLRWNGESSHVDRQDWRRIFWLGFLGNTLYPFVFVLGLDRTKAGNAALLMALTPVFAFLIGVAMKRERFSFGVLTGITLSIGGATAIVFLGRNEFSFSGTSMGDLLMIAAAVCWAWQSVESTRLLPKYGPMRLTVFAMVTGTTMMLPLSTPWLLRQDWRGIPAIAWLGLAYSALLSITYAYFVWAYAINAIGVAHTSVFNNVTPIVALLAGWLLLGEKPALAQISGVVLVLVGVFLVRTRSRLAPPVQGE
jgi:drug/metabolite transporter (DMT)-like permease